MKRLSGLHGALAVLLLASACGGPVDPGPEEQSTEQLGTVEQRALCYSPAAWYDGYAMFSNSACGDGDFAADAWLNSESKACTPWASGCYLAGDSWQCVEWAERYFWYKWGVRGFYAGNDIRWGNINGASDMCNQTSQYYTDRKIQKLSATSTPIKGDLMVWGKGACGADPTWGHVAVVTSVGSTSVGIAQQNAGSSYLTSVSRSCAACWIRANANKPGTCGPTPFTDICDSKFKTDIEWAYLNGITSGCAADKYCPDGIVTRGQMATFLNRKYGYPSTTTDYFDDDDGNKHEGAINRVAAAGITSGCGTRLYCPDGSVTRGQLATFISRASKLPSTTTDYFWDDEGNKHEANINKIAKAGISSGCDSAAGKYCPDGLVTRGQMAAFLHRAPLP